MGWGDAYRSHLEGQSLDITNIPTGDYYLIIKTDPNDVLLESNEDDNQSSVKLHINKEALTFTILDGSSPSDPPPPLGNVVIDNISPNNITAGESGTYEIFGSGFINGITVSLANGIGPAPTVSNVIVDPTGTKITATITAKKGGQPTSIRYWDLVIGSTVRPACFLVFP